MPPGPKRRGHQNRRINDIRDSSEDKQKKISKNQNKEHFEEIKRERFHENTQKCDLERNIPNENEIEIEKDEQENCEKINPSIKKYSKRSVNLNWNRYEEKIEGKEEKIGTDYQLALDCSSSALSQLRLIDEKSWDEEFLKADSNDFTCIHCDILTTALECIPFHNQLDISDEFFMADMLNEFNNNADLQRKTYVSPKSRMIYKGTDLKNDLSLQKKNDVKHIIESLSNCLNSLDEVNNEKKKDICLNKDSDDDETLDMLLSLSEDKYNKTTNKLVLPCHSENQNAQSKTNIQNVEKKMVTEKPSVSLSDWLDSIVED